MELPKNFDITPTGRIVERAEIGQKGYAKNIEYELQITLSHNGNLVIQYYGEDDTYLSVNDFITLIKKFNK
jgi:hypothetical protein